MSNRKPNIAIITALPTEHAAVHRLISLPEKVTEGNISYTYGKIAGKSGHHNIVLASLTQYGNNMAAITASKTVSKHPSVRDIIMVGIGGGMPRPKDSGKHTRLGDIVVSSASGVVQYDFGTFTLKGFKFRGVSPKPSPKLLQEVNALQSKLVLDREYWNSFHSNFLKNANIKRPSTEPKHKFKHPKDLKRDKGIPKILCGRIGTANAVMKNGKKRDTIANLFDLLAFEMEGAGIADAAWLESVGYLIVRGIADYSDPKKNDAWHDYAAHSAAAYVGLLLSECAVGHQASPEEDHLTNIIEKNLKKSICSNQADIVQFSYMMSEKHKDLKDEFYGKKREEYLKKYFEGLSAYAEHKTEEVFSNNILSLQDYFKDRASDSPRICIKIHERKGANTFIVDLYRESTVAYSTRHQLDTNSGFHKVYRTGQYEMVSNIPAACKNNKFENPRLDLSKAHNYEPLYKDGVDINWVNCWEKVLVDGKELDVDPRSCYKSTMIIPMTLWGKKLDLDFKSRFGINKGEIDRIIYGYLCFDHTEKGYFTCMDAAIGYIIADLLSLYLINQMIFTDRSRTYQAVQRFLRKKGRLP